MDFKKYIPRYKAICKKHLDVDVSNEEAVLGLTKLVTLFRIIDKPITKAEFERLQKRRKELEILT